MVRLFLTYVAYVENYQSGEEDVIYCTKMFCGENESSVNDQLENFRDDEPSRIVFLSKTLYNDELVQPCFYEYSTHTHSWKQV